MSKPNKSRTLKAGRIWTGGGKPKPKTKPPILRDKLTDADLYEPRGGDKMPFEKMTAEQEAEHAMDLKIKADRAKNAALQKANPRLNGAIFTPHKSGKGLEQRTQGVRHEQKLF